MTARQRITTGLGTAVLAGSLVASFAFVPVAGAGEVQAGSGTAAPTLVLDKQPAQDAEKLAREGMAKMLQAARQAGRIHSAVSVAGDHRGRRHHPAAQEAAGCAGATGPAAAARRSGKPRDLNTAVAGSCLR